MLPAFELDRAVILERLGGDEEIFNIILDMFVQDAENNCRALEAALLAGNAADLRREAHTIKGLLVTVSDDAGAAEAAELEQQAKVGNLAQAPAAVAAIQARMRSVAATLAAALAKA